MIQHEEEWRSIAGFESYYEISNFGNVRSLDRTTTHGRVWRGRPARQGKGKSGHLRVRLCKGNVHHWRLVHRLVLETFVGPCPPAMQCAHNNGDPTCNQIWNLRWDTIAGNAADRLRHGTQQIGEQVHTAKLSTADIARLRHLHSTGMLGKDIAQELGCTPANVSAILTGKTWRHVCP